MIKVILQPFVLLLKQHQSKHLFYPFAGLNYLYLAVHLYYQMYSEFLIMDLHVSFSYLKAGWQTKAVSAV